MAGKKKATAEGAFSSDDDLNPWLLLSRHLEDLNAFPGQTGFVTNQLRRFSRYLDAETGIGESFLLNTRMHAQRKEWDASAAEYFCSGLAPVIARSGSESIDSDAFVRLPEPLSLKLPFSDVAKRRHSVRRFTGDFMELSDLATLLHHVSGITHSQTGFTVDEKTAYPLQLRSVPSSGGLYAVTCFCFALNVKGLPVGAYQYRPFEHALARINAVSREDMVECFIHTDVANVNIDKAALALLFVGNHHKLTRKYGNRGVRYILIETGMMAFAANLASVAIGWGVLDYQSFFEDAIERCLRISNREEYVLHAQLLGWPVNPEA